MEQWTGAEAGALRRALRMSLREFADRLGISHRVVSRWEAGGRDLTPRPVNQQALDTLLEWSDSGARQRFAVAVRGTLDQVSSTEFDPVDDVKRRAFLQVAVGVTAGSWVARPLGDHDGSDLLTAVASPTMHYRSMEQAVPTKQLAAAVEGHQALAARLVSDVMATSAGFAVLSEVTGLAAWLAVDQGHKGVARTHYLAAIAAAERAGHSLLAAYMRASLGQYATESGDPIQGLMLLQQARANLDDAAPDAAQAWLAGLHAIGYATAGDSQAARVELRMSEKLAARQGGEPAWPWIFIYDDAKAVRHQASALTALGDLSGAQSAYRTTLPTTTAPKARALVEAEYAQALVDDGQVAEGCEYATTALRTGRRYGSERITERVRTLRGSLPVATTAAAGLDQELAALYTTGS